MGGAVTCHVTRHTAVKQYTHTHTHTHTQYILLQHLNATIYFGSTLISRYLLLTRANQPIIHVLIRTTPLSPSPFLPVHPPYLPLFTPESVLPRDKSTLWPPPLYGRAPPRTTQSISTRIQARVPISPMATLRASTPRYRALRTTPPIP